MNASFNGSDLAQKLMSRFMTRVDNCCWDLTTGKIGVIVNDEIISLEGEITDDGINEPGICSNIMSNFGMPLPAFAQNVPLAAVKIGDLVAKPGGDISGWVISKSAKSLKVLTVKGTESTVYPPKVNMMGGDNGVMVVRTLGNMLGGESNILGLQAMLLPMLHSGMDIEGMLPMMLMMGNQQPSGTDQTAGLFGTQGGNMMQQMLMMSMQMQMFKSLLSSQDRPDVKTNQPKIGSSFFDRANN